MMLKAPWREVTIDVMVGDAAQPLDYAEQPRTRRRRWMVWVGVGLLAAALAVVGQRVARVMTGRLNLLAAQRACLDFDLPAGAVAYDDDPTRATDAWAALSGSAVRGHYMPLSKRDRAPDLNAVWLAPEKLQVFTASSGNMVTEPTLFLHGRSANGREGRRLVCVTFPEGTQRVLGQAMPNAPMFEWRVFSLASPLADAALIARRRATVSAAFWDVPREGLRFDVGQPDPADESHFTIGYETPDGRGTIDGWLMPDDTVKLEVRDGPAARR